MAEILVFDLGASSGRAMLCGFEDGKLSLREIHRFKNTPITENGHLRWDTDDLFEQIKLGISFGVFSGGFDAISIDTWGVDFGLIGRDGELLEKPVHYRDKRTEGIPEAVYRKIPAERLFKESGIQPSSINTIFQLAYLAYKEPTTLFRAEKLLMMPDLFAYFLTGEYRNEYTEAATSQLIELKSRGWNLKLIEALGLPKRIFCPLIRPGETYGSLKYEYSEEFRCEQVPVFACPSHDTASAALAVPASEDRFVFISTGTWALFGTELQRPIVTKRAMELGLTNEGGYGDTTMLLKNIMGLWLVQECRRDYSQNGEEYSFADLERLAAETPDFDSFIDPNDPMFAAPGEMPRKIQDYCRATNQTEPRTVGETMRCVYQSLACEFARTLKSISEVTGTEYERVYMVGGGTKDKLLCSLTADICEKPVVAGPAEAAALGNGISALIAMGEIQNVKAARAAIISSGLTVTYTPKPDEKHLFERYMKLVSK